MSDKKLPEYLFWFVAIKHDTLSQYIEYLEKYLDPSASLLIAKETAKGVHKETLGQHIHVACDITNENYFKFHDWIHKKTLKLQCKAGNGVGKQVGKMKNIKDQYRVLTYMVKDQDLFTKNFNPDLLEELIKESFPKTQTWDEQIIQFLIFNYVETPELLEGNPHYIDIQQLEILVVRFYILNSTSKAVPSRAYIRKMVTRYIMYELPGFTPDTHYSLKYEKRITELICGNI